MNKSGQLLPIDFSITLKKKKNALNMQNWNYAFWEFLYYWKFFKG